MNWFWSRPTIPTHLPHPAMLGKGGAGVGPAWTRGEIERPQGEKDVGGSTVSFYTQEQQQRLGVDEQGNTVVCPFAPAPASPLVATHRGTHPHHTHTTQ